MYRDWSPRNCLLDEKTGCFRAIDFEEVIPVNSSVEDPGQLRYQCSDTNSSFRYDFQTIGLVLSEHYHDLPWAGLWEKEQVRAKQAVCQQSGWAPILDGCRGDRTIQLLLRDAKE